MISIIVAIYNEKDYLPMCIESIIHQTYQDIEILLIDDGSKDGSGEICEKFAKIDNRIKVFHKNNGGVSSSRNLGLRKAIGDFILFVDGDDYIHPQFCEIIMNYFLKKDIDIVFVDTERGIPSNYTNILPSKFKIEYLNKQQMIKRLFSVDSKCYTDLMVWGKIYRRSLLEGLLFKNIIGEDIEFNSRLLQRINIAVYIDLKLYIWVRRPDSISCKASITRDVEELNVWLYCLNNFQYNDYEIRGFALKRFYLNVINRNYRYQKEAKVIKKRINEISSYGWNEFKKNKSINWGFKCAIKIFLLFPSLYFFFLNIMKYRSYYKK
ncbi:MAG: glycosyltransferase family 2 protein [Erysipelotrichales bacterium]|nr:glycosyltransferase family 2 protein [Erysipelotrichales bacterium]